MIKIFVTGDNHIGKKYARYPEAKDILLKSRFDCMKEMVHQAEKEHCDFFVVTGDLFDNINHIAQRDVKQVVEILAEFNGRVLVLPGNHDYYTGEEKVWKDFIKYMGDVEHDIVLLNEFREYTFDVGDKKVIVYPAYCQSKHSEKNNLAWIKECDIEQDSTYRIGVAHGAIAGIAPDMKQEYFSMTETELEAIPVDVWLIGHTHIAYPELETDQELVGHKIYNAGTHEQTDLSNSTEGVCFVITLNFDEDGKHVSAYKYKSGKIHYHDLMLTLSPNEDSLRQALQSATAELDENSVVRVTVQGSIVESEYKSRGQIYQELFDNVLAYEIVDDGLSEQITIEKIRTEFSELSFAAKLLEQLLDNPKELQMAYDLMKECSEE